jgi:hypothetical protein
MISEQAPLFTRRRFIDLTAKCAVVSMLARGDLLRAADGRIALPPGAPDGVGAIIEATLRRAPETVNTDWFGTLLMHGLLRWSKRGVCDARAYAEAWLSHHANQENVARYQGPKSRIYRVGGIPITTYCSHFGLAMPCYEIAAQYDNPIARQVCVEMGSVIVEHASRNEKLGLINHDDVGEVIIPDASYFIVSPLMISAEFNDKERRRFHDVACEQMRHYIDVFLVRETGLAKTMYLPDEDSLGKTYWTRASGWLMWAMTSLLRFLPETDPRRAGFIADLRTLARGVGKKQDASGGLHVLLDDASTPLETTGTAMFADGVHESIRRGWLDGAEFQPAVDKAWAFVRKNITDDGNIVRAFTGWARPAEERRMVMDHQKQEWVPGFILRVSDEMTLREGGR